MWCTYGDGVEMRTTIIATDENGTPIEVTTSEETTTTSETTTTTSEGKPTKSEAAPTTSEGMPPTPEAPTVTGVPPEEIPTPSEPAPETPKVTETQPEQPPPTTPETPKVTEGQPEQPPTTPETPKVTETPPEAPPAQPPSPSITILYKVKESVMEGQPTGAPIENQIVKLFPTDEPDLPGIGSKEAEDTNFDADPVQCTTGADGACKMQVPMKDRPLYGLPSTDAKPGKYYRLDSTCRNRAAALSRRPARAPNLILRRVRLSALRSLPR